MENNKNKKSVKFQGDVLNFCDFIQVFVFTRNHHLNGFSVAVCCILVIYQKKLSMPRMTLNDICFEPGMSDFSTAALLRRIEAGALKAFHSYFSRNGVLTHNLS